MKKMPEQNAVLSFVDSLLGCTGQLMVILDHMARHPGGGGSGASIDQALRSLLEGVLAELGDRTEELNTAAALIATASDVIGREVLLVPHDTGGYEGDSRRAHRRRR